MMSFRKAYLCHKFWKLTDKIDYARRMYQRSESFDDVVWKYKEMLEQEREGVAKKLGIIKEEE